MILFDFTQISFTVIHPFIDVDKQPVDSLSKVAAFDIDKLLSKKSQIIEDVIFNIQHSLLKEWAPESLGVLPKDTMQQLLTEVNF